MPPTVVLLGGIDQLFMRGIGLVLGNSLLLGNIIMANEANAPKHFVCILLSTLVLNCSVKLPTAFVWAKT